MNDNELYNIKDVLDYQIFKVAKNSPLKYDELYQIAYMGYLKAQKNYNPEYGKITLNYATKYIRKELITALRKEYDQINNTADMEHGEEGIEFLENQPEADVQNRTASPILKQIRAMMHRLPSKQQEVIKEFYFVRRPKRLIDLAKEKGVSKQRIHQLKAQGLEMIRVMLQEEE